MEEDEEEAEDRGVKKDMNGETEEEEDDIDINSEETVEAKDDAGRAVGGDGEDNGMPLLEKTATEEEEVMDGETRDVDDFRSTSIISPKF